MNQLKYALLCTGTALLSTSLATAQVTMTPMPTFGTNGWLAPGSTPYLTTGNTERGFSYNPTTNNLVLVARQNVNGVSNNVRILDGTTGADIAGLDNTGVSGGTFAINMVDVDASGAIYACNLSTSATSPFKVYKWDNEALGVTTPPSTAYDSVSGVNRTGDAFCVTGGLVSVAQFAAAGSNNVSASNFVVGPLDGSNASTKFLSVPGTTTTSNDYRLGMTFVDQQTLIGTQGGTARMTSFDTTTGTSSLIASISFAAPQMRACDYAVVGSTPVLAVINSSTSEVTIYDITDPTTPVVLASANATGGSLASNINGTGSVQWGFVAGTQATLYAMSTNQGLQAFNVDFGVLAGTTTLGVGCDGLTLSANSAPALGNSGFELVVGNVPAVSPFAFVGFGTLTISQGTNLAAVGMAGCFGYTNLDLGLYPTGALSGGSGSFGLAIPAVPALIGGSLSSQGVSLSTTTALGIAVSNGLSLQFGF